MRYGHKPVSIFWDEYAKGYRPGNLDGLGTNLKRWIDAHGISGRVLDVGSGTGRLHHFIAGTWPDRFEYHMCDISPRMARRCYELTGYKPVLWDGYTLPYPDDCFDLVLSFSVLLHVPPQNIRQAISEHVRVAKRHLFVSTYQDAPSKGLSYWCFHHDYGSLFNRAGLSVANYQRFAREKQCQWLLKKGWIK